MTSIICSELILAVFHSSDFPLLFRSSVFWKYYLGGFLQSYLPLLGLTVLTTRPFCFSSATSSQNPPDTMLCDWHVQHCNALMCWPRDFQQAAGAAVRC